MQKTNFFLWVFIPVIQILLGLQGQALKTLKIPDCEIHSISTKWKTSPTQFASSDCKELYACCYKNVFVLAHICSHFYGR